MQLAAVASPLVQAAVDSEVLRSSARCHREYVQTLVHTKPPGTSAGQVDLDPRRGFAKQASRKRATKEPEPRNTEVFPEEADSKTQPSPEEKAPTTRKAKTKQAPKPKTRKPKTSYEKKAAQTPKPQASAEEEAPKTPKPQASAEEEAPKTPKPQASAEEEAPKTPKHTPDDLELELERLIDEADRQEMDIASETEKSALPRGSRSMLSEKAAELFDSFTKATASRPANWSSPASKSADKESPEQSSGGKAGNTGSPEQSSGGKAGDTGSQEQSSRGKAGNTGSPEQSLATQESVDPHDKEGQTLLSEGFVSLPIRSCQQVSVSSTYPIPTRRRTRTHTVTFRAMAFQRSRDQSCTRPLKKSCPEASVLVLLHS